VSTPATEPNWAKPLHRSRRAAISYRPGCKPRHGPRSGRNLCHPVAAEPRSGDIIQAGVQTPAWPRLDKNLTYVANQRETHRVGSFQDEYREFLIKHSVEFDEKYLWG
jgi:hypothetical protein